MVSTVNTHADVKSDSGIDGPPYEHIVRDMTKLADENDHVELIEYGFSSVRKNSPDQAMPLVGVLIKPFEDSDNINRLTLITGATHGNEYVHIVDRLPSRIVEETASNDISTGMHQYLQSGGAFLIIPIVNPYGYSVKPKPQRRNADRLDLNRDFPTTKSKHKSLRSAEISHLIKIVDDLLHRYDATLMLTVDYHCCYEGTNGRKRGALMYSPRMKKIMKNNNTLIAKAYAAIGQALMAQIPMARFDSWRDLVPSDPKGTSTDYWQRTHHSLSFTYEGEEYLDKGKRELRGEHRRFQSHYQWLNDIMMNGAVNDYYNSM
ncbi:MAG: succinylglutamate desuccinylase/aspartoacylase family protein [Bdellovibrionota bacterium]